MATASSTGLRALLSDGSGVTEVLHGTTIGSNTVLEGKGARTGLITTKGFRDILEIRDLRMPVLYDLHWTKPRALVERRLRLEVVEKLRPDGSVAVPLDMASVDTAIAMLRRRGGAERRDLPAALLRQSGARARRGRCGACGDARCGDLGQPRDPAGDQGVSAHQHDGDQRIRAAGGAGLCHVAGGAAARAGDRGAIAADAVERRAGIGRSSPPQRRRTSSKAVRRPAWWAVRHWRRNWARPRVITFDMGGTTAKAGLVEHGEVLRSEALEVGAGVMAGSRLLVGAGYLLKLPAIDLAEVGAGGGSICRLDAGGAPKVGPESAGAEPGPVCYGRGGTLPTITDCNLVLGYLDPGGLVGGTLQAGRRRGSHGDRARVGRANAAIRGGSGVRHVALGVGVDDAGDPRGVSRAWA